MTRHRPGPHALQCSRHRATGPCFNLCVPVARLLARCNVPAGYLIASRKEVDSVELPYMNRARLAYRWGQAHGASEPCIPQ